MHSGKLFLGTVLFSFLCVTGLPNSVDAQVANGTFDGFTSLVHPGWEVGGKVTGRAEPFNSAPTATEPPATMHTPDSFSAGDTQGCISPAQMAAFIGGGVTQAQIEALDSVAPVGLPTLGSAIGQTFNVAAGQVLTFQWNHVSFDSLGDDFSFMYFSGPSGTSLVRLAGLADLTSLPDDIEGISGETGLKTFTSAPLAAGSYGSCWAPSTVGPMRIKPHRRCSSTTWRWYQNRDRWHCWGWQSDACRGARDAENSAVDNDRRSAPPWA